MVVLCVDRVVGGRGSMVVGGEGGGEQMSWCGVVCGVRGGVSDVWGKCVEGEKFLGGGCGEEGQG